MKRKQASLTVLACLVFLFDGVAMAGCWMQIQAAQQRREQAHRVIEQLEALNSNAQSLRPYARRYVDTGNESDLARFSTREDETKRLFDQLTILVYDDQPQRLNLIGLRVLVAERTDWLHQLISVFKAEGKTKALALARSSSSLPVMEKMASQVAEMKTRESIHLNEALSDYRFYRAGLVVSVLLLTLAGGIAMWLAVKMSSRSARLEADQILNYQELNKQLNTQVSELLRAQQEANNALMARSQFLARVSHELRTPLAGIIGATELALQGSSLPEDEKELIGTARECGKSLLGLVNDILDFETLELQELRIEAIDFDLHMAIQSCLEPIKFRAQEAGIAFQLNIAADVPRIVCSDRLRLQQILINLTDNATKFTAAGNVSVAVSVDAEESKRTIVNFEIIDTGVGITPEFIEQVWEPFIQGDRFSTRKHGGSGLGLSISKKLVELLDGEIGVSSKPGNGSRFFFKVPLAPRAIKLLIEEPATPLVVAKMASVLVVDDNATIRLVSQSQLKHFGCQVVVVASGREALELTSKKRFDLILMDIQMADMDGVQATNAIRASADNLCRTVPVIAYTAHAMPGDEEKYLAAGMNGYLAKPVSLDDMRKTLDKWISVAVENDSREASVHNEAREATNAGNEQVSAAPQLT